MAATHLGRGRFARRTALAVVAGILASGPASLATWRPALAQTPSSASTLAPTTSTTAAPTSTTAAPAPTSTAPASTSTTLRPPDTTTTTAANRTAIISIRQADLPPAGPAAAPGAPPAPVPPASAAAAPAQARPTARAPGPLSAALSDWGRLSRLLEDAQARRARLSMEIAGAQQALAALEAEHRAALAARETATAGGWDLLARRDELLGPLARAEHDLRAAETRLSSVAAIGRTTPVAHPPTKSQSPAQQRAEAAQAESEARARAAKMTDRLDQLTVELGRSQEQTGLAAAKAEALAGQVRAAQEAVAALAQKMAEVNDDLTASGPLMGALGVGSEPSALARADIPADTLALYRRAAATCPGLPWSVLAAVGSVETSHGRVDLPGVRSGANFAGAMGPMQFLEPTWAAYGVDGDADGRRDVYHPVDAVFGAANYLCASGAGRPSGLVRAIWDYNHADWYVEAVLEVAAGYGAAGLVPPDKAATALVEEPKLTLSPQARDDLLGGVVDSRLVALLGAASAKHAITVSVIRSGHAQYVGGTDRVSNHYHGRGVDISAVDGAAVSATNEAALELALSILASGPPLRPDELGSPWTSLADFAGAFTDDDHADHLHLGWRADTGGGASPR